MLAGWSHSIISPFIKLVCFHLGGLSDVRKGGGLDPLPKAQAWLVPDCQS